MTKLKSARIFSVFFLAFLPLLLVSSSLLSLDAKTTVASGVVALGLFAFAASWGFRCSKCHESIFMRRGRFVDYSLPWPNRCCSKCGEIFAS
jgi:hypothetical protein